MDEVSPGLYVGSTEDAGEQTVCQQHGIDRVISLTYGEPDGGFPDPIAVEKHPLMDGPRNDETVFAAAVEDVLTALEAGECVLVHCAEGSSRSPSVAATAAAIQQDIGMKESFRRVQRRRAETDPHDAVVRTALDVFAELS